MVKPVKQSARMRYFSTLAGPFKSLPKKLSYKVQYKNLVYGDSFVYRYWTILIAFGSLATTIWFGFILFNPSHWIINLQPESSLYYANLVMLICLAILQVSVLIGTVSATRSTLIAKNPEPVRPQKGLRVAFATTRAPGEPVEMVEATLKSAKRIRKAGSVVDIWLLDETKDKTLMSICKKLDVNYFSRAGVAAWNTPKNIKQHFIKRLIINTVSLLTFRKIKKLELPKQHDPYLAARSKHGNFNSWHRYLKRRGITYDILAGVDTDQAPEPNYLERLLGYFRDEDVAYVVGPQVYGNYKNGLSHLVARWAESQASFFQSTIQRAGNHSASPMFVGTNYAVRMKVLDQINGFQPCITEDMATGLAIHTHKNPDTGKKWKSVYTPDVLAIGEGPDLWGTFFTQQWRWAAGTFDTWRKVVWRKFYRLSPGAMAHYFLMLTFYPIAAVTWFVSVLSSILYLATGATAILAPWSQFVSLYFMVIVMQLSLYFWNRQYNVSPHEPRGSYGVGGLVASTLMAPVYFSALIGILFGKKPHFVVTVKGTSSHFDRLSAFNTHLRWAALLAVSLIYGFVSGHDHPAMMVWAFMLLFVCVLPVVLGMALPFKKSAIKFSKSIIRAITKKEEQYNA